MQKGNFRSCIFYIRQLSETHSVALSLSFTHSQLQESASMFSKIEFLKIVLGKEETGNMKAPVEPTTLPIAQPHAPLHFVRHTHTHTHSRQTHNTHSTHTMCIWQFSLVLAHHQHLLFGTVPNRCSSRECLFFCIPCNEHCLVGCVSWIYKYTMLQVRYIHISYIKSSHGTQFLFISIYRVPQCRHSALIVGIGIYLINITKLPKHLLNVFPSSSIFKSSTPRRNKSI